MHKFLYYTNDIHRLEYTVVTDHMPQSGLRTVLIHHTLAIN